MENGLIRDWCMDIYLDEAVSHQYRSPTISKPNVQGVVVAAKMAFAFRTTPSTKFNREVARSAGLPQQQSYNPIDEII